MNVHTMDTDVSTTPSRNQLMEWTVRNKLSPPKFTTVAQGPAHFRTFTSSLTVAGKTFHASGSRKRDAEAIVSQIALASLESKSPRNDDDSATVLSNSKNNYSNRSTITIEVDDDHIPFIVSKLTQCPGILQMTITKIQK